MRKKFLSMLLAVCCCVIIAPSVGAEGNNITIQAIDEGNSSANFSGFVCEYKYTDANGNVLTTGTVPIGSDGRINITKQDSYGLSYSIKNPNGDYAIEDKQLFYGNSNWWDTDPVFEASVSSGIVDGQNVQISQADADKVKTINLDKIPGLIVNDESTVSNTGTRTDLVSKDAPVESEYGFMLQVVSDYNLDLMINNGFSLIATGEKTTSVDIKKLVFSPTRFGLPTGGSYSFTPSALGSGVWAAVTPSVGADGVLLCSLTPKCVLSVINGGKAVSVQIKNQGYSADKEAVFGVVNGETYNIINLDNNQLYTVTIPTNATNCRLDLSQYNGVPVNPAAKEEAVLTNTGDYDNPFNVPLTSEREVSVESIDRGEIHEEVNLLHELAQLFTKTMLFGVIVIAVRKFVGLF